MRGFLMKVLQGIPYIVVIVAVHLAVIKWLGIRIAGQDRKMAVEILKAYSLPFIVLCVNTVLLMKRRRLKYKFIYFFTGIVPGVLLLIFLNREHGANAGQGVQFFPAYQLEMLLLFPVACFFIQGLLWFVQRIEPRNEKDCY